MARALSLNGAVLPLRMLPAQPDNPLGFWESKDVVDINDRLLAAMDLEWSDPFLAPQARYLSNIEGGFFDEAVAALQGNFEGRSPIVLKDPRISVLNEFWGRVLVRAGYRPVYVIMVRNPIEVASSLTARNGFSRERALLIWASHMVAAVRDTAESVRVFISYDQLISDWRGALARVESATGATLPRRSATASVETDRFISVAQRHHHSEPPDGTQIWPPIVELYELALRAANGAELDRARFAAVSAHLEQLQGLLAPVFAEGQLDQKTLRAAQYIAASEASALSARVNAMTDELSIRQNHLEAVEQAAIEERRRASESLAESTARIAELEGQLSERDGRLEAQERAGRIEAEELATALSDARHQAEQLESDLVERQLHIEALERAVEDARVRHSAALGEAAAHVASLEATLAERQDRIEDLERANDESQERSSAQIAALQARIAALEGEISDRQARVDASRLDIAEALARVASLEAEITERQSHLEAMERASSDDRARQDEALAKALARIASLEAEIDERRSHLEAVERASAENHASQAAALAEALTHIASLQADVEHGQLHIEAAEKAYAEDRVRQASDLAAAQARAALLEAEIAERRVDLEVAERSNAAEQARQAAALAEALAQIVSLEAELAERVAHLEAVERSKTEEQTHQAAALSEALSRVGALEADIAERQAYVETMEKERAEAFDEISANQATALARISSLETELADRQSRLEAMERTNSELRAEFSAALLAEKEESNSARQSLSIRLERENTSLLAANELIRLQQAENEAAQVRLRSELAEAEWLQRQTASQLDMVLRSTSWRLTSPVRRLLMHQPVVHRWASRAIRVLTWVASGQLPAKLAERRRRRTQAPLIERAPSHGAAGATTAEQAESAPGATLDGALTWRGVYPWARTSTPYNTSPPSDPYDRRPDDDVPTEAARGAEFLARFDLLGATPQFGEAVDALNQLPRSSIHDFSKSQIPDVSIIIPVYGQLAYTLNCLHSLICHKSRYNFEIIIGDDVSPDESRIYLPQITGVDFLQHQDNGGFIRNCNSAANHARGKFLVFLNNDTRVVEHWLDELIEGFELFPKAGLIGSKLFYPDGVLQEAGGILWRYGSAWNYGRGDDPNRPQFTYARQVDYISGAAIALPTEVWREFGGFDEAYAPAYCEDSDLALKVATSGRQVWLQPRSRVIHYEGRTSGTDVTSGVKAYQVVNHKRLFERWGVRLASHRPNADAPERERERSVHRRVLVIDATAPTPNQDAGSVTTIKVIEVFQALGYKVTYVPLSNWLYQPDYIDPLLRRGVECLYAPYYVDLDSVLSDMAHLFDVIHVFRFQVLQDALPAIRRHCPRARLIFNNMDLHYLRLERQAEIEGSAQLRAEAEALKAVELRTMSEADIICVPSSLEQALLQGEPTLKRPVAVMPFMIDMPRRQPGFGPPRRDILFLGGYRHRPNVDAAEWLAREIWPRIADLLPDARLILAGANPTLEVLALAGPRIEIPGRIDDLEPLFRRTLVFAAPLRYGAGVKGKLYTAFSYGVPCVTTTVGAEGMDLEPGRHALIADDAAEFAEALVQLATNGEDWSRLSAAGLGFVAAHHTVDAGARVMESIL